MRPFLERSKTFHSRVQLDVPVAPAPSETELASRLAARTLELIDIPSESRAEAAVAAHVASVLRDGGAEVVDLGDSCVLAHAEGDAPARAAGRASGHRAGAGQHPGPGGFEPRPRPRRVRHEGRVRGDARARAGAGAYAALFFPREELPSTESALTPLLERASLDYDFVVVMEPTDNELHAGCVGNINATWTFRGRSGHSARPWQADNAIHARRAAASPRWPAPRSSRSRSKA